ncbi:MAG: hypothetical protein ACXAD7_12700, partial [Candidatus Kariarchaeaceae archaeon]
MIYLFKRKVLLTRDLFIDYQFSVHKSQKDRLRIFMYSIILLFAIFFFAYYAFYGYSERFIPDLIARALIIAHSIFVIHVLGADKNKKLDRNLIFYLIHLSITVLFINYDRLPYPTLSILLDIAISYTVIFLFPIDAKIKVSITSLHLIIDLIIND